MRLLEEKSIREKVINECIKMENELKEYGEWNLNEEKESNSVYEKIRHLEIVDNVNYAVENISELRTKLLCLFDKEE